MKVERRYIDFMQDIVDNLEKAESFTQGMEFEDVLEDEKTRYSVICALEFVGEACKKVSTAVRLRNPQVPWKEMAGMRDRLIHGYFGVDGGDCLEDGQRVCARNPVGNHNNNQM